MEKPVYPRLFSFLELKIDERLEVGGIGLITKHPNYRRHNAFQDQWTVRVFQLKQVFFVLRVPMRDVPQHHNHEDHFVMDNYL